ncbi:sigma-70 family RNA polymerase sigma factor [Bacillus cereus]|uniref:sigma-70 family RNA polymerase sigma factor n=1 Tax=Bacillus cereus TaxID=1396 RepID=UPI00210066FA|nr:sigma-70 family RNA polymerase sigma factor [Bacillus cereus]
MSFLFYPERGILMDELIKEYNLSLNKVKIAKESASEEEQKILVDMISDLEFALTWMRTGRRENNSRGIERRAAYQRERAFDPLLMQRYFRSTDDNVYEWDNHLQEHTIGEWEKIQLEDALSVLTEREKEVYLMSRGYCLPYSEIANYLIISRSTVQTMVERAEKKIIRKTNESLFCLNI